MKNHAQITQSILILSILGVVTLSNYTSIEHAGVCSAPGRGSIYRAIIQSSIWAAELKRLDPDFHQVCQHNW